MLVTTAHIQPGLRLAAASGVDLGAAIDAFVSQPDLAPTTRAKYRQTLTVVEDELGGAPVTASGLVGVVDQRWHCVSPATWNRHVATVQSFARYCTRTRILEIDGDVELQRRADKHDHTRSITVISLERLWERRDIELRERTLWRLLYETAARADEALRLNVEDLDIPGKGARTRSKGGDIDWLFFASGSARLLPRLIGRPARRPGAPVQPAPEPGPRPSRRRHLPADGPGPAVLIKEHVVVARAWIGLDRRQAGHDRHRRSGQVKHRVGHPVERRRMQRHRLRLRDLSVPTLRSIAIDSAARAFAPQPRSRPSPFGNDESRRGQCKSSFSPVAAAPAPRTRCRAPTSNPTLNVFSSSACNCAMSSTTARPTGTPS